jgi:two-component system chemotaxis response regulator CheB
MLQEEYGVSAQNIRALVVDDAAFMRKALVEILSSHDGIEVVGVARHGREALEAIEELRPDVITLDVDMPVMDGITTIKHIMVRGPIPVVMVSGLADEGRITFEALRLGAVDFFPKPSGTISRDIGSCGTELARAVKVAAAVNPMGIIRARTHKRAAESRAASGQTASPYRADDKRLTGQGPSCAVMVLATHGAAGKLFRFLYGVPPEKRAALWAAVDLPDEVIISCARQIPRFLGWRVELLDDDMAPSQGLCRLFSAEQPPPPSDGGGSEGEERPGYEPAVAVKVMQELSSNYGERLLVVVLGGDLWTSLSPFQQVLDAGGRILALSPEECVLGRLCSALLDQGMAEAVENEQELWEKSRNFIRRSALKSAAVSSAP